MTAFRCLLCERSGGRRVMRSPQIAPAELWSCRACGFVQLHPLPAFEDCVESYEEADHYVLETLTIEEGVLARDRALIAELAAAGVQGPVLDVGAGAGTVVQAALEHGWEVCAVELARPSARRLREQHGVEVLEQPLEQLPVRPGAFGLAIFSHSLEHVPSPVEALRAVRPWLRPDGHVHVAVPHWNAFKRRLAGPHTPWIFPGHLSYFRAADLRACAQRADFHRPRIDTHPFVGIDYRYAIGVLRRLHLEGATARFLQLSEPSLTPLMRDDLQLDCPPWRFRALMRAVGTLLRLSEAQAWCRWGKGEELRMTAAVSEG